MATNINQTLEDLIAAISSLAGQSEACCEVGGQVIDDPPSDGEVSVGEGEDYPDAESYFNAKCSAANGIYDTVRGMIDWLRDNNVDLKLGALGAITTALVLGLALAGPVGWALQLSGAVITVLAGFIAKSIFNFIDMLDGLDAVHEELVLALYNAADAETAKADFLTAFEGAVPSPTGPELTLTGLLLPGSVLNQLFVPRPDVGDYESPDPISCPTAWTHTFDFTVSNGGWTNDATHSRPFGTYSAGVGWVSVWGTVIVADERLYLERTGVGGEIIQSVTVTYEFVGVCGGARRSGIVVWDGSTIQREDSVTPDCGDFVHEGVFSDVGTIITTNAVGNASADGALEITITKIVVTGLGTDPF